ncbi:MAG: hypothetical protein COT16_00875 [Elusimicrobia bacterium CG08_land_8_20_14_0_20_44_26]|nr:MAG: hypothetical protein COT16_00875 [Elusimicrobia bacterium CG08_land_8_20_14_0_20_44_26]
MRRIFLSAFFILTLYGCAGKLSYKKDYDYNAIRNIAVAKFESSQEYESAGGAARDTVSKYLIENGFSVVDANVFDRLIEQGSPRSARMYAEIGGLAGADAIIDGSVYRYLPEKEERIYYTSGDGKIKYDTAFYNAKVAVTARLIDVKTGEVVWAGSDYYESFDIQTTMAGAVYTVMRPLKKLLTGSK